MLSLVVFFGALIGGSVASLHHKSLASTESSYRVKYFAAKVQHLDGINSESDFAVADSIIDELTEGLRRGRFTSEELRVEMPEGHLSGDRWLARYRLFIDENRVDSFLKQVNDLAHKPIHEEGDWARARSLADQIRHLMEKLEANKDLLIPRFGVDLQKLDELVQRTVVKKMVTTKKGR